MKQLKLILTLCLAMLACSALAQINGGKGLMRQAQSEFLPVDQAFMFDFRQQGNKLTLSWQIADGYYLYQKQFKTVTKGAELGDPTFPDATAHEDEFFGKTQVFYQQVDVQYDIKQAETDGVVKIQYQGCADAGLCYPPTVKVVYLSEVSAAGTASSAAAEDKSEPTTQQNSAGNSTPVAAQFELADLLTSNLPLALLSLFGAGILLAFTPCVYPMYPIISTIVVGGKSTQKPLAQTLWLSIMYVQGMALTYSLLGLVVASAGVQFQAALQHPAILGTFIVIFILLALVMFGAWELQLPSSWQERLNAASNKQQGGRFLGVFVMGAISGLIASPCTTAPLTAVLLVVAQNGDLVTGFAALYVLSLGMGIPLILFAVTGGKLLPKAGQWMNVIKTLFGFMLLSVALFFFERMVSNLYTELAWSVLGMAAFGYLLIANDKTQAGILRTLRNLVFSAGIIGSGYYGYLQLAPAVEHTEDAGTAIHEVKFIRVKDLADFQQKLAAANAEGKSVMVDLYADWCVACKEFEKYTFPAASVRDALANTVLMQIDLTDNTPTNLAFQDEFDILGLPTILLFDKNGNELSKARITGFMQPEPFAEHLRQSLKP